MTENILISNGEFDAPRLPTESDISSLGLNWPPNYSGSFERVRAAFPTLVKNEQQLQQILSIQQIALNNHRRSVIKAVAPKEAVQQWLPTYAIEAAPVFMMNDQDWCLVYFAANPPDRELQAPVSMAAIPTYLEKRAEYHQLFQDINQQHLMAVVERTVEQFGLINIAELTEGVVKPEFKYYCY